MSKGTLAEHKVARVWQSLARDNLLLKRENHKTLVPKTAMLLSGGSIGPGLCSSGSQTVSLGKTLTHGTCTSVQGLKDAVLI